MSYQSEITKEIEVTKFLGNLAESYGEIASIRMMRIRESVLNNRNYIFSITKIFYDVLSAYLRKMSLISKNKLIDKNKRITFLAHNGKTVCVLVSANTGFYGDVVASTFKKFVEDWKGSGAEATIVGKIGRSMFLESFPGKPYSFFDLPDYGENKDKFIALVNHLVQYDEVRVYYSQYESVLEQKAEVSELTAGAKFIERAMSSKDNYLFEPNPEDILMFFEKEVFGSFFSQTVKESQLSKLSSRVMAMDRATVNITKRLSEINMEYLKIRHREMNRKQQEFLNLFVG